MRNNLLAFRYAIRELRSGVKGFFIFSTCLIIGVLSITFISNLSISVKNSLRTDARSLLGGDIEISFPNFSASAEQEEFLQQFGRVSSEREMRAMARTEERNSVIELRAVTHGFPLYGKIELEPDISMEAAISGNSVAVQKELLSKLDLSLGDEIKIGNEEFTIRAIIEKSAADGINYFAFGPEVIISQASLEKTGLTAPGSIIKFNYKLALDEGQNLEETVQKIQAEFPDSGYRIKTYKNSNSVVERLMGNISTFISLIALVTLFVGGLGIAISAKAYLLKKHKSIAILKTLGAPAKLVFRLYFMQIIIISLFGIFAGVMSGIRLSHYAIVYVNAFLPFQTKFVIDNLQIAISVITGLVTVITFTIWHLDRASDIKPSSLIRGDELSKSLPKRKILIANIFFASLLIFIVVMLSENKKIAVALVAAIIAAIIFFILGAEMIKKLAEKINIPISWVRLGIANINRPNSGSNYFIISLGVCLSLIVAVSFVETNFRNITENPERKNAPTYFFIDIQETQVQPFKEYIEKVNGAEKLKIVPMLRANITKIKGVPVSEAKIGEGAKWAVRGDRGLTYSATIPDGAALSKGKWWASDYKGPPLLSFDARLAREMNLDIGDKVIYNVLGEEIEATIYNLRKIDYTTMQINFASVFSPGILDAKPKTYLATVVAVDDYAEEHIFWNVPKLFPNVLPINLKDTLATVSRVLDNIAFIVKMSSLVALIAAIMVLFATILSSYERRRYYSVILKVFGARRVDIVRIFTVEFAYIALITSISSCIVGTLIGLLILSLFNIDNIVFDFKIILNSIALSLIVTLFLGVMGNMRVFRAKPLSILRNE